MGGGRGYEPDSSTLGQSLTDNLLKPPLGPWRISSWMMGEVIPMEENHVRLSPDQVVNMEFLN